MPPAKVEVAFSVTASEPPKVEVAVEVATKYGAAIERHASRPPAKVEVPVPVTAMLRVVVGESALWPKVLVVTTQSRKELLM